MLPQLLWGIHFLALLLPRAYPYVFRVRLAVIGGNLYSKYDGVHRLTVRTAVPERLTHYPHLLLLGPPPFQHRFPPLDFDARVYFGVFVFPEHDGVDRLALATAVLARHLCSPPPSHIPLYLAHSRHIL